MSIFDRLKGWFTSPAPPAAATTDPPATASDEDQPSQRAAPADASATDANAAQAPRLQTTRRAARAAEDARIEAEARALFAAARNEEALALLGSAIWFVTHAPSSLPCLCRSCLRAEAQRAEHAGVEYQRDFVVAQYRVLFYWAPSELQGDARRLRNSMRQALVERLSALRRGEDKPRQAVNPFTGELMEQPRRAPRRKPINPFTDKRVP